MLLSSIDHLILAVPDLEAAAAPFERLGLTLTPTASNRMTGNANRVFFTAAGEGEFYVELLARAKEVLTTTSVPATQQAAMDAGGGLSRVTFAANDDGRVTESFIERGIRFSTEVMLREDFSKIGTVVRPDVTAGAGCDVALIKYATPMAERVAGHREKGLFEHAFPLKRLDHIAVVAPDLDAATAFWGETLGVPLHGEVPGRGMTIRQLKIGDAILELIGPDSPDSPMASRPAGLISMAAYEVQNLDEAVALARERGFTAPDPTPGVLPGTRTSTIPPKELSGLALQLLEYV